MLAAASTFTQSGNLGAALDVVLDIDQARYRVVALSDIVSVEARTGSDGASHHGKGRRSCGLIKPERCCAVSYAWSRIAAAWLVVGDYTAASTATDNIANASLRTHLLARIAAAYVRVGETAQAARFTRRATRWLTPDPARSTGYESYPISRSPTIATALAAFRLTVDIAGDHGAMGARKRWPRLPPSCSNCGELESEAALWISLSSRS